jgi:hypothetical protein
MRLHPITRLLLVAVILRLFGAGYVLLGGLSAVEMMIANLRDLPESYIVRPSAREFAHIAEALLGVADALWVEGLFRVWRALKDGRLDFLLKRQDQGTAA